MTRRPYNFDRTPLRPDRLRKIDGSFAFLPHRFLRDGFWASLDHRELLLYVLLVLVADRQGMSFYFDDRLYGILRFLPEHFLAARAGLIRKDLIAYDPAGPRYQVLALPPRPVIRSNILPSRPCDSRPDSGPQPIGKLIREWFATLADDDPDR